MIHLALLAGFVPVTAVADVTNSKGRAYRVETCFIAPERLTTRFVYPDRTTTYAIRDGAVRIYEGSNSEEGADGDRRFALGHNFHAIALNAARWGTGRMLSLPFGGKATVLTRKGRLPSSLRLELPDTTAMELSFSDWRDGTPYRVNLLHAGVTYDYRYRTVRRRCTLN